jgi:hypothetical protein
MSATQRAATITPGLFAPVISVITITGIGDHLRPEWPITFTEMRIRDARPKLLKAGLVVSGNGLALGSRPVRYSTSSRATSSSWSISLTTAHKSTSTCR